MRYFFYIIIIYILSIKFFMNTSADVQGKFQSSSAAYIIAGLTLLFIVLMSGKYYKNIKYIKNKFFYIYPLLYYIHAFIFSIFSLIPIISIFRAVSGIGFILVGSSIGRYLGKFNLDTQIKYFYKLLIIILITEIIGRIMGSLIYNSTFSILNFQAGYVALISIYLSMWHLIDYISTREIKYLKVMIFFMFLSIMLHSFSALLSFYVGLIFLFFYQRKFILFTLLILMPIFFLSFIINYLEANMDMIILGKPAAAYLIGSGRFDIYEASIDAFSKFDFLHQFIGIGFMSERNILSEYDLSWSTDPHNSFLVSLLGLGFIGATLYFLFCLSPFLFKKKLVKSVGKDLFLKWISLHILFTIYGITSSSYLAVPSIQLILFIVFSYIVFSKKEKYV